jgi:hypothetical protein
VSRVFSLRSTALRRCGWLSFPPVVKGGARGVGTHSSDILRECPTLSTGISNDLVTGFFAALSRHLARFRDRVSESRRGR